MQDRAFLKVHVSTLFPKRNATFHAAFLLKKSVLVRKVLILKVSIMIFPPYMPSPHTLIKTDIVNFVFEILWHLEMSQIFSCHTLCGQIYLLLSPCLPPLKVFLTLLTFQSGGKHLKYFITSLLIGCKRLHYLRFLFSNIMPQRIPTEFIHYAWGEGHKV